MKNIISIIICVLLIFSCSSNENKKTLQDYKQIWKNTFLSYQNSKSQIKKHWIYDFEFTIMIDWKKENLINKFSFLNLNWPFNSLSFKVDGDYDFLDENNLKLNWNLKLYLNKRNYWVWDLDINFTLENNKTLKYTINNWDKDLIKFLLSNKEQIEQLIWYIEENKWKELKFEIQENILKELFNTWKNINIEKNIYNNSKNEETKIINSFLENEVIEILSWESINETDKVSFKFNSDNFIKFLNQVAIILWENWKNFDWDKKIFKNLKSNWELEIKNYLIQNSAINTDIILNWIWDNNEKKEDKLNFKSTLKLGDLKTLNVDFTNLISSSSTPENKLQFRIKLLLK